METPRDTPRSTMTNEEMIQDYPRLRIEYTRLHQDYREALRNKLKKKQWTIEISQNGWEYTGTATITAIKVEKINETTVLADGIEIEFDEEIRFDSE